MEGRDLMKGISREKKEAFLRELTELSNKYGIMIDGCGCCGSPWIEKAGEKGAYYAGDDESPSLNWDGSSQQDIDDKKAETNRLETKFGVSCDG